MSLIEVNWKPTSRELRQFSAAWLVVFGLIGGYGLWSDPRSTAALIVSASACIGLLGLVRPRTLQPLYIVAMLIALPIGWVVSHVLLAIIYFVVFTFIGLAMRLAGHDPLQRKFDRMASTYWQPRNKNENPDRYFKEF
jgi:hypothetical protein